MNYKKQIEILFDDAKLNLKEAERELRYCQIKHNERLMYKNEIMERFFIETNNTESKELLSLFHQANSDTSKIGLVETTGGAIIGAAYLPNYTWMSTGSLSNHLLPIKNRTIVAFPKKGGYDLWKKKATDLNAMGYNITVSKFVEKTDLDYGSDLADLFMSGDDGEHELLGLT